MAPFDELHLQNHKLVELSVVLTYLLQERSMCDTETANSLLFLFLDKFDEHMKTVDSLYQRLLNSREQQRSKVAEQFMSGERELKRILGQFIKKWCVKGRKGLIIGDHEQFHKDTQELFDIVLSRIQDETERLYPHVREIQEDSQSVA